MYAADVVPSSFLGRLPAALTPRTQSTVTDRGASISASIGGRRTDIPPFLKRREGSRPSANLGHDIMLGHPAVLRL